MLRYLFLLALVPNALAQQCFETAKQYAFVESVEDDGTVVLENIGKIAIEGVDLPPIKDEQGRESLCRQHTLRYLRARLDKKHVNVYPIDAATKDEAGRVATYIVLENGEFLNKQLLRLGLATHRKENPQGLYVECSKVFASAQSFAEEKKLGIWGRTCK